MRNLLRIVSGKDSINMKISKWKKWLSYFKEVHLESTSSIHNPELHVSLVEGRHQLSTENAIYSFDDKYDNFAQAFEQVDWKKFKVENVLILGLGLASIPFILEKIYKLKLDFTCVEIDEQVIFLAEKYILKNLNSHFEIISTDAGVFIDQCLHQYDLICMDVFENDFVPPQFETVAYLNQLKTILSPGGMLMYNRLALTDRDKVLSQRFFDNEFSSVFKDGYLMDVDSNFILINDKKELLKS